VWPINETLNFFEERMMATLEDVKAEISTLKDHIATEGAEVKTAVTALQDQVATLQAQIAAGTAVTSADLDDLITQLKDVETGVDNIIAPPATE
jgi:ACT domain-containing protein